MFEIRNHPITTLHTLRLSDTEARELTKTYIRNTFLGKAEWVDNDGYLCWNDEDWRHGSVSTIRGEKATQEQITAYNLLKIL